MNQTKSYTEPSHVSALSPGQLEPWKLNLPCRPSQLPRTAGTKAAPKERNSRITSFLKIFIHISVQVPTVENQIQSVKSYSDGFISLCGYIIQITICVDLKANKWTRTTSLKNDCNSEKNRLILQHGS